VVERPPLLEGKSMHISVASTHKPKGPRARPVGDGQGHPRSSEEGGPENEAASDIANEAPPVPPAPPRPEPDKRLGGRLECETVPKMKSHKGTAKRIGVTGGGKAVRVKSGEAITSRLKSSRRTRRYDGKSIVTGRSLGPDPPASAVPGSLIFDARVQAGRNSPSPPQAPSQRRRRSRRYELQS